MINSVITPKKIAIRRQVMTFLRSVASGSDNPTPAIMIISGLMVRLLACTRRDMLVCDD